MTATMNTGAETIRVDRAYLPLLLQLKTAGAVGTAGATAAALERLEEADVLRNGRLHPMADAILDLVAEPGLVVSVERTRAGDVAAATIWATLDGATIGSRVDRGTFELRLASTALLPFHVFQLIHLRPLPESESFEFPVPAAAMFAAEAAIRSGNQVEAVGALAAADVAQPADVADLLAARVASWRIHSIWADSAGPRTAEANGMDCGDRGHVLIDVDAAGPSLRLRSAAFAEVTAAVRRTLPANR